MCDGPKFDRCLGIQLMLRGQQLKSLQKTCASNVAHVEMGALCLDRPHLDVAIEFSPETSNNADRFTPPGARQVPLCPAHSSSPLFPPRPPTARRVACQRAGCPHNLARIRKKSSAQQSRSRTPSPRTSATLHQRRRTTGPETSFSPWSTLRRMRRTGRCRSRRW